MIKVILITLVVILSIVNYIFVRSGYPSLLDILKELYLTYVLNAINPFKYNGFRAIVYYSYSDKTYNASILVKERIEISAKSLRELRKMFITAITDYLVYRSYD